MDTEVRTVLMTTPDAETGERLGRLLVEERLAACANVLPGVTSVFRWEGEVQRATEALVVMKTRADRVDALLARAAKAHPYDVPELLVLAVEAGLRPYLDWVRTSCDDTVPAGGSAPADGSAGGDDAAGAGPSGARPGEA